MNMMETEFAFHFGFRVAMRLDRIIELSFVLARVYQGTRQHQNNGWQTLGLSQVHEIRGSATRMQR
jgi:hypothetical protein